MFLPPSGADSALTVERGGVVTSDRRFDVGQELTFRCVMQSDVFVWMVPPFLDGTPTSGTVRVGESATSGMFQLSASGNGSTRMSTLQFTLEVLMGDLSVTCRNSQNSTGLEVIITVLGESITC